MEFKNTSKTKTLINSFIAILLLNLIPTIYDTIKVAFINNSNVSINIFGQIEWFDLINETVSMFLIVPLYYIINKYYKNKENLSKLFIFTGLLYVLFILLSITQIGNLTEIMNATDAKYYLFLESVGFILGFIYSFAYVYFVVKEDYKTIYSLLFFKVITMVGFDLILNNYADGYAVIYAGILSQLVLSVVSLVLMIKEKSLRNPFDNKSINKNVLKDLVKIGFSKVVQYF